MFGFKTPHLGASPLGDMNAQDKLMALSAIFGDDQKGLMDLLGRARDQRSAAMGSSAGMPVPKGPLSGIGADLVSQFGGINLPGAPQMGGRRFFGFGGG